MRSFNSDASLVFVSLVLLPVLSVGILFAHSSDVLLVALGPGSLVLRSDHLLINNGCDGLVITEIDKPAGRQACSSFI